MGLLAGDDGTFGPPGGALRWLAFLAFMFSLGFAGAAAASAHEGQGEIDAVSTTRELDLHEDPWSFTIRYSTVLALPGIRWSQLDPRLG